MKKYYRWTRLLWTQTRNCHLGLPGMKTTTPPSIEPLTETNKITNSTNLNLGVFLKNRQGKGLKNIARGTTDPGY